MSNQDENKTNQNQTAEEEIKEEVKTEEVEEQEEKGQEEPRENPEAEADKEAKEQAQESSKEASEKKEYDFNVGDTVVVSYKIKEDNNTRIQKFEGIVISKRGSGISKTFTVRKIGANNVGIERIFPLYSPNIADIDVKRRGKVRRAKLYYLRERKGKAATYVPPAKK